MMRCSANANVDSDVPQIRAEKFFFAVARCDQSATPRFLGSGRLLDATV
jgi:hypothetical protein